MWEIKSLNSSQPMIQDLQQGHAQKTSIIGGKGTWFFGLAHSDLDHDDDERSEKCAHNEQKMNVTARKNISRADVNYMRFRKITHERSRFLLLFTFFTLRKRERYRITKQYRLILIYTLYYACVNVLKWAEWRFHFHKDRFLLAARFVVHHHQTNKLTS